MAEAVSPLGLRAAAPPIGQTLSIFNPVFLGIDEFGHDVYVPIIFRNLLPGGEPGAGKSSLLNNFVAHAALSLDCRLILLDGKRVELGLWKRVADVFVGPDIERALRVLRRVQQIMDNRYEYLDWCERRKIEPGDQITAYLLAVDEIAYFSVTVGDKKTQEEFSNLLRDVVARGRAVGIMVVAATQRPSSDIIPTSLRDLFAWRFAGRCTTDSSSDVVLGHGWAARGFSANTIAPNNQGVGYLIAEGGVPKLVKSAYLSDLDIRRIARYAERLRAENTVRSAAGLYRPELRPDDLAVAA
ncbi:FtsK/SpoIIIE domain-containing protein [Dactylosporangium sp. McL0621]|uniref:FtsK/SpoIIIE domain-containing protein n=1 Tax=Dactylosporangium sp. McL0621 TaxID=3415678 RepID=UPI003CF6FBDF